MAALAAIAPSALHISPKPGDLVQTSLLPYNQPTAEKTFVSRRTHTKSRGGCSSCKRRRQKCDEEKPCCSRCVRLGFECDYTRPDAKACLSSLRADRASPVIEVFATQDSSEEEAFTTSLSSLSLSTATTVTATLQTLLSLGDARLTTSAANDLSFFITSENAKTFGDQEMQTTYRISTIRMGMTRPYLMHSLLAVSAMQRRIKQGTYDGPHAHETTHWQRATQLFRARLAQMSTRGDTGALLATASFMNGLSFASIGSFDPYKAWPIADPPDALLWLGVLKGPALLLEELRKESGGAFGKQSAEGYADRLINNGEVQQPGIEGLAKTWVDLYELTPTSTATNNCYQPLVRAVCYWMPKDEKIRSSAYFSFVGAMNQDFICLLRQKDHRALLLLAHWYALLISAESWWCRTRAHVECKSICMYLEQHGSPQIQNMLDFPAMSCGYQLLRDISLDSGPLAMTVPDNCSIM